MVIILKLLSVKVKHAIYMNGLYSAYRLGPGRPWAIVMQHSFMHRR